MLQRRFRILAAKREYSRLALEKENQFVHGEATLMQAGVRQLVKKRAYKRCVTRDSIPVARSPALVERLSSTHAAAVLSLSFSFPFSLSLLGTSSTGSVSRARPTSARCSAASNGAR